MAVEFRVQMEGLPELQRRMKGLRIELRVRAIRVALRAAAKPVVEEAKRLAPVGTETGTRKRTFRSWDVIEPGKLRREIMARVTVRQGKTEVAIGPSWATYYGMFVELGTSFQAAQPFLRPALDNRKEQAVRAFHDILAKVINKYAERAGTL